ncbi:MAG: GAF domain-containing protein [Armatimonadetes bacterium]|nr:GAF domain-containing protein [Armatimonadota bacterium]
MIELGLRWVLAGLVAWGSHTFYRSDFGIAWRTAALYSAFALFVALLERNNLRRPAVTLAIALADSLLVGASLARAGYGGELGMVAALPFAFAGTRYALKTPVWAPIVAGSITLMLLTLGKGVSVQVAVLQGLGALAICLLARQPKEIITIQSEIIEVPAPQDAPPNDAPGKGYLALRESYRSLRDHYNQLLRKCRKDRCAAHLYEAAYAGEETLAFRVAHKLRELTSVTGLTLYSCAQYTDAMSILATSGEVPSELTVSAVPIRQALSETQIRNQFDLWLRAIRTPETEAYSRSLVLKDRSKIIGVLCLSDPDPDKLQKAFEIAEEAAPAAAKILREGVESDLLRRKLREAELLYQVSTVVRGSESAMAVASRAIREMWDFLELDHLAIHFVDGESAFTIASQGASSNIVENLVFGVQRGLSGWLAVGAPEAILYDATDDDRVPRREALQRRVGSFALVPIQYESQPFGFLTAATHRAGGIDLDQAESLRTIAAELSQAIARVQHGLNNVEGLATPGEFRDAILSTVRGSIVHLEILRREEISDQFGRLALDQSLKTFARKLRVHLPHGSLLCRRNENDYVVLLPECEEEFARQWANQASALAAMSPISTPDGKTRIPLAFRAKVSPIRQQSHQLDTQELPAYAKSI